MKNVIVGISMAMFVFFSCNMLKNNKIKEFMPGTYVKEIKQEFASGMDTIIVETAADPGVYKIIRRSSYQQQIDGKLLPPKYEVHNWTAIFNPETRQLQEQNKGKVFTFSPEQNTLTMGSSEYRKIK